MVEKSNPTICFLVLVFFAAGVFAGDFDANDFVVEVVSYDNSGAGDYDNPFAAIGRPTVDIYYYGVPRPLVPVIQAEGIDQVVRVGRGGHLELKFNHRVGDDDNNPHGIDFIVFGNAFEIHGDEISWDYTNPNNFFINGDTLGNYIYSEKGIVSVSQDGVTWYCFDNGPFADTFAPTLGRIYDPNNPVDAYPGWVNLWWGEVTDPTVPLDPNFVAEDFAGQSVAQMCVSYGVSAGGTGFDLQNLAPADYAALSVDPETGRKWIQYVKIKCADPYGIVTPEVDAISDVACCGDYKHPFPAGDINRDCRVDFFDFALLAHEWLQAVVNNNADIGPPGGDGAVDIFDLAALANTWLECTWKCE